jgi:hypothetical protein
LAAAPEGIVPVSETVNECAVVFVTGSGKRNLESALFNIVALPRRHYKENVALLLTPAWRKIFSGIRRPEASTRITVGVINHPDAISGRITFDSLASSKFVSRAGPRPIDLTIRRAVYNSFIR